MLRHEFLTPDLQVQRAGFADGSSFTVDLAKETHVIYAEGEQE